MCTLKQFGKERERLNKLIEGKDNLTIKRFFNLDQNAYKQGALSKKTKEILGLVASLVLRCDDCINYHLVECKKENVSTEELEEAVAIALIVGGSITIPHVRKLFDLWEEMGKENNE